MKKQTFASVWDALEDSPQEAENMRLRAELMSTLIKHIHQRALSQEQAAKLLGVTQPRVSDLMRGKIERFGLDMLVNLAASAGLSIRLLTEEAA